MSSLKRFLKKTFIYSLFFLVRKKANKSNLISWLRNKVEIMRLERVRGDIIEEFIPKEAIGAELGVLKGNFSKVLLNRTDPKELHLIDPWYLLDSEWRWASGNQSTIDAVCHVLKSFKKEIAKRQVYVHVQDDIKVLSTFPDNYFDWAYVDSSHEYEHTLAELNLLHKKVMSTGVICGDDWRPNNNHQHHGVYKAVNEFILKNNYSLIYSDKMNLQWFIKQNKT